ncbi:hypothetical protein ABZ619_09195 [Streptomyces sp. NPDC007851]|uniref:hypothetical protein n=1 Tax=Streptomyces sp. NPDC007851 TaxID=3155008 RepID=UPI0033F8CE5C
MRGQIVKVCAAETPVAVVVGTTLAAVATALAAVTQHASLSKLVTDAPMVVPWSRVFGTVAIRAVVAVPTASGATWRATRRRAIEAADIRE